MGVYYCDIAVALDGTYNYADFGASYNLPSGYSWGTTATRNYLAGSYNTWTTTEIEVYRIYWNKNKMQYLSMQLILIVFLSDFN